MSLSGMLVDWLKRMAPGMHAGAMRAPAIGRTELRRRVVETLQPLLKERGFGRFEGNIARRRCADWIDVVQIRFDPDREKGGYALVIEMGRHLTFIDIPTSFGEVARRDGQPWPNVMQTHLRKRLFRRRRQPGNRNRNFWQIGARGEWLDETLLEVAQLAAQEILPWFAWIDDLATVLGLIEADHGDGEGKGRDALLRGMWSPGRAYGPLHAAFIAFRLQRWEQCCTLLEPVVARGGVLGHRARLIPIDTAARARLQRLLVEAQAAATEDAP